jgi:hypothetical protein
MYGAGMVQNPYDTAGFHDAAIAAGRHRAIVGGRWDETGRVQMAALLAAGLQPHHHLLDIGAGAMRLGCKAVPYLDPGHYWATDASLPLLRIGRDTEIADPARLPLNRLIVDAAFDFPGVPDSITHAIAFALFPHLPMPHMRRALTNLRHFPRMNTFLFSVFLAPDAAIATRPLRQPDGVVTHDIRPPYHVLEADLHHFATQTGWQLSRDPRMLPRGQVLFAARTV